MRYFGGKQKITKYIAPIIQSYITDDTSLYLEPFVGGGSVISAIKFSNRIGYDIVPELIYLLDEVEENSVVNLPDTITEEEYVLAREGVVTEDYLRGFIGFGCSFGGKWFGGYAKSSDNRNYCLNAKNSLKKKSPGLKGAQFLLKDFFSINPEQLENAVIYCDPPYKSTTLPGNRTKFDHDLFWENLSLLAKNNTVLVSEYQAPDIISTETLWEKQVKLDMNSKSGKLNRVEKLFLVLGK